MSESIIDVSELTRRFGNKTALASVSLSLPHGAVYGLVGATGAGKTTLIRHLLGLLRADTGSNDFVNAAPKRSTGVARRRVTRCSQAPAAGARRAAW